MERKRHKVNYLSGFNKKRVVSQYAAKYVTLLSSSPHESGSQVSGSPFLCIFVAPLSHQLLGDEEKCAYLHLE